MRLSVIPLLALVVLLSHSAALRANPQEPKRDILGLHLEMTKEEAKKRLAEIGSFEREERKQQEIWQVRDPSFSHVIIGMSKEGKLRFITAIARDDQEAKPVRYRSIGDLNQARQAGDPTISNFRFEWTLPPVKDQPEAIIVARGRDPEILRTYSLKRTGVTDPPEGKD